MPGDDNLWLLPSGEPPPNPAELLNGRRVQEIFSTLRELFDLVLIDSPPVLPVTDAVVLSKDADATLLVVAAGQTSRGDLQRAAEKLGQVEARVTGIVLNETTTAGRRLRLPVRLRRHLRVRPGDPTRAGADRTEARRHPTGAARAGPSRARAGPNLSTGNRSRRHVGASHGTGQSLAIPTCRGCRRPPCRRAGSS